MIAIVVLETTELSLSLSYAHTVSLHTVAVRQEESKHQPAVLGVGVAVNTTTTGSLSFPLPPPLVLAETDAKYRRLGSSPVTTALVWLAGTTFSNFPSICLLLVVSGLKVTV